MSEVDVEFWRKYAKEVAIPARDTIPQLLGQLCGHAMNRNGKAVAEVLEKIYTAVAQLEGTCEK